MSPAYWEAVAFFSAFFGLGGAGTAATYAIAHGIPDRKWWAFPVVALSAVVAVLCLAYIVTPGGAA